MASVLVAHMCETDVELPTEGSGIVPFFVVSWIDMDLLCQTARFELFTGGCGVRYEF